MIHEAQSKGLRALFIRTTHSDFIYPLASLVIQLSVGLLFGHVYDQRISMATGYLVATGQNPYIPQDLTGIFHNPAFQGMTSVGYPPPWPMLMGFIYLISYAVIPNLLLYNLAIKLPIIAANFGLAYLVRRVLEERTGDAALSRKAWTFLLFNPFLLYFTTAWGQFDSLVALMTLLALVLLDRQKDEPAALLLALAISFKPISIPVVLAAMVYLWGKPWLRLVRFLVILAASGALFCIAPFILFGWDASPVLQNWNAQFTVSGGMSLMTFYEQLRNTYLLPGRWWLLGLAWIPAVCLGTLLLPPSKQNFTDLLKKSLVLILIFYLTRTWLSEPNLSLVLAMVLILTHLGELPNFTLTMTWAMPLIFTIFNTSPPQLLFPIQPDLMTRLFQWMDVYRHARLEARMVLVIPWQITGWWMVVRGYRKGASPAIAD